MSFHLPLIQEAFPQLVLTIFVKATCLLALITAAVLVCRRCSAATRAAVWNLGLGLLLLVPLLSALAPSWHLNRAEPSDVTAAWVQYVPMRSVSAAAAPIAAPPPMPAIARPSQTTSSRRRLEARTAAQSFVGKPRSTVLVDGSGQRLVMTFCRVKNRTPSIPYIA